MFRDLEASESLSFLDHQLGQSPVSVSRDACRVETETLARLNFLWAPDLCMEGKDQTGLVTVTYHSLG